jgi:Bacterial Ig-like domain (group 2).
MKRQALALTVLVTMIGCDSPTRPDSATRATGTVTGITISGDGNFTELNQVHLLLVTAQMQDASVRDVTADATWQSSDTSVVTVSARGEATAVGLGMAQVTASYRDHQSSIDVRVVDTDAAVRLVGRYRFTVTASPVCGGLPDWAKHREYNATIDPAADGSTVLNVTMTAGNTLQFEVKVKDTSLNIEFPFHLSYGYYGWEVPTFWDQISPESIFMLQGTAEATLNSVAMSGKLLGQIRVTGLGDGILGCGVQQHQFTLARR